MKKSILRYWHDAQFLGWSLRVWILTRIIWWIKFFSKVGHEWSNIPAWELCINHVQFSLHLSFSIFPARFLLKNPNTPRQFLTEKCLLKNIGDNVVYSMYLPICQQHWVNFVMHFTVIFELEEKIILLFPWGLLFVCISTSLIVCNCAKSAQCAKYNISCDTPSSLAK